MKWYQWYWISIRLEPTPNIRLLKGIIKGAGIIMFGCLHNSENSELYTIENECFSRKYHEHVSDHIKQIYQIWAHNRTSNFSLRKIPNRISFHSLFRMDLLLFLWSIKQNFSEMLKFYSYRTNAHLFNSWSSFAEFLCLMSQFVMFYMPDKCYDQ